jgi:predicted nucleic acid-binding protein
MPASPVLADSSFYIRLLRQGQDPLRGLRLAAATGDVAICGVVRCEVGRALRPASLRQRFQDFWDVMINVPTDNRLWSTTEQMLWDLDRAGTTLPLTDVLIACCAQRIGAVVLTHDHHFSMIPGVRTIDRLDL